jgi:hypothetical protein
MAVPFDAWLAIVPHAIGNTGYTHQVAHKNADSRLLEYCMVSVDTPKQASKYHAKGFSTFRVKTEDAPVFDNEIECKADSEGISCLECGICAGKDKPNVYINVHGSRSKRYTEKFGKSNLIAIG